MSIPHDKFCVLPWISIEASPVGTIRPCCLADDDIVDNEGNKFKLDSGNFTFTEVQNSDHMRKLREQFLAGEQPQTCRKCWNEERSGRTSKRMYALKRLKSSMAKHFISSGAGNQWTTDAKPLMFLDLKLGNICNLKCRICGPWSSSQFATEEINQLPREEQKSSHAYQMLRAGAWPRENTQFWQQIDSVLTDIRYIEFTGGEPFMIDEHFDMLQGIIDRGIAHQVEIHYNTNGTHYPKRGEAIWQHFKTVEVAFSIDDVGERFEYQRTNSKWTEVENNIQQFKLLRNTMPKLQLQCCSTVNVFNVRYIDELARWIVLQGFDFMYWNMMHDSWYFSIAALPDTAKVDIAKHLRSADIPAEYREEFDHIINFMLNGASTDGFILRMKIEDLDRKRQQNLREVEPELADLIDYGHTKN